MGNQYIDALTGGFKNALFQKVEHALGIGVSPTDLHGQLRHQAMNARNAEHRAALLEASGRALDAVNRDNAGLLTQAGPQNKAYTPQYGAQSALGSGLAGVNRANAKYEGQLAQIAQQEAAAGAAAEQQEYDRAQAERKLAQEDARIAAYGQGQSGRDASGKTKLSVNMENQLEGLRGDVQATERAINGFDNISKNISMYGGSEGLKGKGVEWIKNIFGSQDQASLWKTEWTRLINAEVVNNLPPGVASDRDIALVKSGFPDSNWDKAALQSWADTYRKILAYDVAQNSYVHDYILENREFPSIRAFQQSSSYDDYIKQWSDGSSILPGQKEKTTTSTVNTPNGGTADVVVDFDFTPSSVGASVIAPSREMQPVVDPTTYRGPGSGRNRGRG